MLLTIYKNLLLWNLSSFLQKKRNAYFSHQKMFNATDDSNWNIGEDV